MGHTDLNFHSQKTKVYVVWTYWVLFMPDTILIVENKRADRHKTCVINRGDKQSSSQIFNYYKLSLRKFIGHKIE